MKKIYISLIMIFMLSLSLLSIKGRRGDPIYFQDKLISQVGGPFESTGSTSRYALTQSIVESNSFFFNDEQARASAPDITKYEGKVFSIFTPGVSFIAIPFYSIGKRVGFPQLITYLSTLLFAFINTILIWRIVKKLGLSDLLSLLAGFVFFFATNSFAYAFSLTQHHLSATITLAAILIAMNKTTMWRNFLLGLLYVFGLMVDIPNGFALLPAVFYVLSKHFMFEKEKHIFKVKTVGLWLVVGLIPLLIVFGYYNMKLTGSYFTLAQIIGRADYEEIEVSLPAEDSVSDHGLPLDTRNQLEGFYVTLVSNERGILFYNTITIFGFIGLILLLRNKEYKNYANLLFSTAVLIIVLYSFHGDPWGGWSFGSRYMVPVSAVLAPGIIYMVKRFKRNYLFSLVFILFLIYGVMINTAGALTTTLVPPKVEAVNLLQYIPYTYKYNFDLLREGFTSSLIYDLYLRNYISVAVFYYLYFGSLSVLGIVIYLLIYYEKNENE